MVPVGGGKAVVRVAFPPGGRTLLTWHADDAVRLWDLKSGDPEPLSGPQGSAAALSDDARRLFTLDGTGSGQVWDLETGKADGPPLKLEQDMSRAAVSADGRRLALVAPDGGVRVWDAAAAKWLHDPVSSRPAVRHVALSPDGERVATAGGDQTIQVWRVGTDQVVDIWSRSGAVTDLRFSPDGRWVIAGNGEGERVWDAATGQALTPPLRQGSPFAGALYGADGREVVTLSRGGVVCVWGLPPPPEAGDERSPEEALAAVGSVDEIAALARLLASGRINREQRREPLDGKALRDAWVALHPGS
jgi:WD40 repeat protein